MLIERACMLRNTFVYSCTHSPQYIRRSNNCIVRCALHVKSSSQHEDDGDEEDQKKTADSVFDSRMSEYCRETAGELHSLLRSWALHIIGPAIHVSSVIPTVVPSLVIVHTQPAANTTPLKHPLGTLEMLLCVGSNLGDSQNIIKVCAIVVVKLEPLKQTNPVAIQRMQRYHQHKCGAQRRLNP